MRKRAQEGGALKQANLNISMHLLQNISLDYIGFAHGFPTSMYTQKGRQPYLFYLFEFDAASFTSIWAKIKVQDVVITHLQRDEGKIRR